MIATRDGDHAVAADPERDALYVVRLSTHSVDFTVPLRAGDEPGRLVEDGAGRIHVALRSGGALATLDPTKGTIIERHDVCAAPRGVAWDAATDLVWVACATGELVALPAAGGAAVHTLALERDLRDVVVGQGSLSVTKFRSAEVLRVAGDGSITRRDSLPSPQLGFAPHVAWRAVAGPSGTLVTVHQAESTESIQTQVQGGYGGGCAGGSSSGGGNNGGGVTFPGPGPVSGGGPVLVPTPAVLPAPPRTDASTTFLGDDASGEPDSSEDAAPTFSSEDAGSPPSFEAGGNGNLFVSDDSGSLPPPPFEAGTAVPGPVPSSALPPACLASIDGGTPGTGDTTIGFFSQTSPAVPIGCLPSGIVLDVLTVLGPDGTVILNTTFPGVLPVDVAVSSDGLRVAAVAPGNSFTSSLQTLFVFSGCGDQQEATEIAGLDGTSAQPTAVAFAGAGRLLVQTRQPAELHIYGRNAAELAIPLSSTSREDTGHDVFHVQAGGMIACASCHPEGRDDGHVWTLDGNSRRTPSLQGTIAGTAPYHWPGDQADMNVLVNDVYTVRMNGVLLPDDERGALTGWVEAIPAPPPSSESSASRRGQTLFERADVGCATCHSGPKFTNNKTVDVGTGGAFQVPPLVGVAWRTPLMHDGCAATIADRFGACSTPGHGSIGALSGSDVSDLVAYLETL